MKLGLAERIHRLRSRPYDVYESGLRWWPAMRASCREPEKGARDVTANDDAFRPRVQRLQAFLLSYSWTLNVLGVAIL